MTTRSRTHSDASRSQSRITRPNPSRLGPIRYRTASRPEAATEPTFSEEVSEAVKHGYDVITENIRQGRFAAEQFRNGDYSLRQLPDDLAGVSKRLIDLARELSNSTFDVAERAVRELGGAIAAAKDRDDRVPAFRPAMSPPGESDTGRLRLTTRCVGHPKAVGRSTTIERPKNSVGPADLSVDRLMLRKGGSAIAKVQFEVDLSQEGVVAVVTIPPRQGPGVYSGLIYAKDDSAPLGTLTIEILT